MAAAVSLSTLAEVTGVVISGSNTDPFPGDARDKPYEMVERTDDYTPLATFENCETWLTEWENAEGGLYRSDMRKLYRDYSGRLRFQATGENAEVTVRPVTPLPIPEPWDSLGVWNHGSYWVWQPHTAENPWPQMSVLLQGADGKEYEIGGFSPLYYDYWFLQRRKENDNIPRPARFAGLRFRNFANRTASDIYLDSVYFYAASAAPLKFEAWPGVLPFPLRNETIQPRLLTDAWRTETIAAPDQPVTEFRYTGSDGELLYHWDRRQAFFDGLTVDGGAGAWRPLAGATAILEDGAAADFHLLTETALPEGAMRLRYELRTPGATTYLDVTVSLRGKSLVAEFAEDNTVGRIAELRLGHAAETGSAQLFRLPFLTYGSVENDPRMIYAKGLYGFSQFDWYVSDATLLQGGGETGDDFARFNGAAVYRPKTDGKRNLLRERLFLNVSAEPWEVFPTVDNPPSPYRAEQAGRLWRVAAHHSPEQLTLNQHLRELGLEKITIRYHEDDWRDGGESYTFRLNAAPGRGGDAALRDFVHDIQALGWKIGLYTNYTDLAPVNPYWDQDHALQLEDGNWLDSWSRCYAPKPMWAVEMQARLAPQIQQKFGEDHSYCDVHTAVTPFSRVDFDARVPGAGTFRRTFECFGRILFNEKFAHKGPVYSEGYNHWWYAGLTDGNYSQLISHDKAAEPWFPDFQLRQLHPLEMAAGMGSFGMFLGGKPWNIPLFIATSFAYGNIGFADAELDDAEIMRVYYLMQPVQSQYVMEPVKEIRYERDGVEYPPREALANGAWRDGRLHIIYANGFEMYLNRAETPWHGLPQWGWELSQPGDRSIYSTRRLVGDSVVEAASGPDSHYFRSDVTAVFEGMSGCGAAALKREADGWELIPATQYSAFAFAPALIGAEGRQVVAIALDASGAELGRYVLTSEDGRLIAPPMQPELCKFRLVKK